MRTTPPGFTLIELLVVITIIVVLLSLLAPAMDQAVYQAELAVCGTKLHAVGAGVLNYALDHKRRYPHRPAVLNGERSFILTLDGTPADGKSTDDQRRTLRGYVQINGHLRCPLEGEKIDLESPPPDSNNFSSYGLWFGFRYDTESKGMMRMGDRMSYVGDTFDLLAGDYDTNRGDSKLSFGGHPDREGRMVPNFIKNQSFTPWLTTTFTWSLWITPGGIYRGLYDMNFVYQDGSVGRFADVPWDEGDPLKNQGRFIWLPEYSNADNGHPTWMVQLPRR